MAFTLNDWTSFKNYKIESLIPKRYLIGVFTPKNQWTFLVHGNIGFDLTFSSESATIYNTRNEMEKDMILCARKNCKIEDGYTYLWIEADIEGNLKILTFYDKLDFVEDPEYGKIYYLTNPIGERTVLSQCDYKMEE